MSSTTEFRHRDDHEWFTVSPITERTEIVTPWGRAIAEVGTFLMTSVTDTTRQVIATQEDLRNAWTSEPVPPADPLT